MGVIASLFGGGSKKQEAPPSPPPTPEVRPEKESTAKKIARVALIETSPLGDLSPVSTGRRKLLGN